MHLYSGNNRNTVMEESGGANYCKISYLYFIILVAKSFWCLRIMREIKMTVTLIWALKLMHCVKKLYLFLSYINMFVTGTLLFLLKP